MLCLALQLYFDKTDKEWSNVWFVTILPLNIRGLQASKAPRESQAHQTSKARKQRRKSKAITVFQLRKATNANRERTCKIFRVHYIYSVYHHEK